MLLSGRFQGRQTQFHIELLYGALFVIGFVYLVFRVDPRVAAFEGGLVVGYLLRIWEKMSIYERLIEEAVSQEAETQVEAEVQEQVGERVGEEVEEQVETTVDERVDRDDEIADVPEFFVGFRFVLVQCEILVEAADVETLLRVLDATVQSGFLTDFAPTDRLVLDRPPAERVESFHIIPL